MIRQLVALLTVLPVLAFAPVQAYAAADSTASLEEAVPTNAETAAPVTTDAEHGEGVDGAVEGHDVTDAEHEKGGLPQLNIATYPSQVFWLLVAFGVLYFSFSRKVLPSIGSVVDARDNLIKDNLDTAQRLKEQAEGVQASYEKNLEIARAQAMQAVQDVETASKKKAADQSDAFRHKADGQMKSAEASVNGAMIKAMDDMSHVAAEVASIAAEKITGINTDVQKARAIVDSIAGKAKAA